MTTTGEGGYSGHETYEYLNTGTYASPTWVRIGRIEDVDLPSNRSANGYKIKDRDDVLYISGRRDRAVAFKYRRIKGTDPVYAALKAAHDAGNAGCVDFMELDGPAATVGSKGTRGPYLVPKFDESRKDESIVEVDVELKPADATRDDGGNEVAWPIAAITISE